MRPRDPGPFRLPTVGRLIVKATRDDSFGAELLFLVEGLPTSEGLRLAGSLRGPECSRATTLAVTVPLVPVARPHAATASSRGVAARAVLTEPAPWTPELPSRYRLEARLEGGDAADASWRQPFGGWIALRRLGVRGRSFRLDGRRFVLRAGPAVAIVDAAVSLAAARERNHAVVVEVDDPGFGIDEKADGQQPGGGGPLEAFLDASDREGTLVVVRFDAGRAESVAASTAFHPSAAFAIASDRAAADAFAPLRTPSGPLLGLAVDGGSPPPGDTGPADFLVIRLLPGRLPDEAWLASPPPLPLVACRGEGDEPGVAAHPCDALQADLARWSVDRAGPLLAWDWAGYLLDG